MSATADVVVVGGGVVGVSAGYHLAAAGAGDVLLLERAAALGTGSTGACAGGFRHQFSSPVNVRLSQASIPLILRFTQEHGLPLDIWQDGYLFLIRDAQDWSGFSAAAEMQRDLGVDTRLLDAREAGELAPGVSLEGVVGAAYCPDDGIADPAGLTHGYATAARRAGARIELGVEVMEVLTTGDAVTGVRTSAGEIAVGAVVNAAGPWGAALAATVGVDLPMYPVPRHVVTTGAFPGRPERRTLVIDSSTGFYFHREADGVLMGMGARNEQPSFSLGVDEQFLEEELLPTAVRVFPALEQAGVSNVWCGLYEMTPDRHPVIGESPVAGFFLANGFSGHGFQHAPVVGKLLAELIVEGAARTVDVSGLRLERFARGDMTPEHHVV